MNIADVIKAIGSGVAEIPVDIYYGGRRTLEDAGFQGSGVKQQKAAERERVTSLITESFRNRLLIQRMVQIILEDAFDAMSPEMQSKVTEAMVLAGAKVVSKQGAKFVLSQYLGQRLAELIATRSIAKRITKFGVGIAITAVMLQGLLERSSNASKRLLKANPIIHSKLKVKNLDVIYFLGEEELAPYVALTVLKQCHPAALQSAMDSITDNLKK